VTLADSLGLVGVTIADKYRVERVVGEGGFAIVYRAEHLLWKRPVALKVFKALANLPPEQREELTQDFIREGALLAELSEKSASICQARDVGIVTTSLGDSVPYMVLEWLEGEPLEDALQREQAAGMAPRSLVETLRLLDPIAEALALAHARGIAHRDVKPANIFLLGNARDERCPVKLLDFGIAKVVQDIQKSGGAFTQTTGQVRSFTPAYAAPEQFSRSHGATGPWTDVFALALVAVELLSGRAPLEGDSFLQLGFAAGDAAHRPTPREKGAVTSDAVEEVFRRALAVERVDRYPSAASFWRELHVAAGLPSPNLPEGGQGAQAGPISRSAPVSRVSPGAALVDELGQTLSAPAARPLAASATPVPSMPQAPPIPRWLVGLGAGGALVVAGGLYVGLTMSRAPPTLAGTPSGGAPSVPSTTLPGSASAASLAPATGVSGPCPPDMAFVPGGTFFMGSDDGMAAERPAHKVRVAPFCMDIHEVTTARYIACSDAGWCKRAATTNAGEGLRPEERDAYDALCNERDPDHKANHPINCVTWEMADVFCRSNKLRLPTEAEWEFAARGSDGRKYPWGDQPPSSTHLNACGSECAAWGASAKVAPLKPMYPEDDGFPTTAPVGSFPAGVSKFGIFDLAGNVWEWVSDWYGPYAPGNDLDAQSDAGGPARGTRRVIRGGAWNGSEPTWETPSFRYSKEPQDRNHGVGFRCAANVQDAGR
jgi:formylglycine-generating enzyme required for sulfatase activity/serine/threonine protein kinase